MTTINVSRMFTEDEVRAIIADLQECNHALQERIDSYEHYAPSVDQQEKEVLLAAIAHLQAQVSQLQAQARAQDDELDLWRTFDEEMGRVFSYHWRQLPDKAKLAWWKVRRQEMQSPPRADGTYDGGDYAALAASIGTNERAFGDSVQLLHDVKLVDRHVNVYDYVSTRCLPPPTELVNPRPLKERGGLKPKLSCPKCGSEGIWKKTVCYCGKCKLDLSTKIEPANEGDVPASPATEASPVPMPTMVTEPVAVSPGIVGPLPPLQCDKCGNTNDKMFTFNLLRDRWKCMCGKLSLGHFPQAS